MDPLGNEVSWFTHPFLSQLVYHPGVYEWQSASLDFRFPQYGDGSYVVSIKSLLWSADLFQSQVKLFFKAKQINDPKWSEVYL